MSPYLLTLALTIVVETAIALAIAPRQRRRLILDAPLVNLATHPLATLAIVSLGAPYLLVEAAVAAAELLLYRYVTGVSFARAAFLSLVANSVTSLLGLVL